MNRIIGSAIVGGTVSAITGGKFANGAFSAAFATALRADWGEMSKGQLNGFNGKAENDIDLSDYEIQSHSLKVGEETLNYDTLGPDGYADAVELNLKKIMKTDAGMEMLSSIASGDGNLLVAYGRVSGEGVAPGYTSAIQFNHIRGQMIRTNKGNIREATYLVLAHELHHSWGPMTKGGFWGGNDRINIGRSVSGLGPLETYAVRYTNLIRQQAGVGYRRTHYDGYAVP
ncbi:hypothetical protein CWC00_23765 [Pseudoalteromonas rubra]|nr:hypothetical protein CWC00_23765 [Pseudoalteromonas rubra]